MTLIDRARIEPNGQTVSLTLEIGDISPPKKMDALPEKFQAVVAMALSGDAPKNVIVNMEAINYCTSALLNVFVIANRQLARRERKLHLTNLQAATMDTIKITNLHKVFVCTPAAACEAEQAR